MERTTRELLASKVRMLRKLRGWSQEELADACGLHRTYIGGIERAERSCGLDVLERLANAFGITLAELVDFSDLKFAKSTEEPSPDNPDKEVNSC